MPSEHPNISRVRNARSAEVMAKRFLDAEIIRAMKERAVTRLHEDDARGRYTAAEVAEAANVSRARVYQILDEAKEKAGVPE